MVFYVMDVSENSNMRQTNNNKWTYISPLKNYNLMINIFESILIIILTLNITKLWKNTGIFKISTFMSYALMIWTTIGPCIHVIIIILLLIVIVIVVVAVVVGSNSINSSSSR